MGDEISRIIQDHLSNLGLAHVMRRIRAGEAMLHVYTQVRVATDSPEQEQRDLERKYEERIAARGQLKGLCNKATDSHSVPWSKTLESTTSVQHNGSHGTGEVHGDASWRAKFSYPAYVCRHLSAKAERNPRSRAQAQGKQQEPLQKSQRESQRAGWAVALRRTITASYSG